MKNGFIQTILDEEQIALFTGANIPALPGSSDGLSVDHDKIMGGFLGLAIGDALGWPYEGMQAGDILRNHPEIDYLARGRFGAEPIEMGAVSDDTQMSLDVARCLAAKGCIDPDCQLSLHESYKIRGAGPVVLKALHFHRFGAEWDRCGLDVPYNGGAMRALPVGVFYHADPGELAVNAILSCYVTHVNADAVAATVAMAYAAACACHLGPSALRTKEEKDALIQLLAAVAARVEKALAGRGGWQPQGMRLSESLARLPGLLEEYAERPQEALQILGNSVNAVESVSSVLFLFLRTPHDFMETVLAAVRGGNDCDSVASMAGGLCGLLNGARSLPREKLNGLIDRAEIEETAKLLIGRMEEDSRRAQAHTTAKSAGEGQVRF
jgi:ADP-ribosylglycohydrolase